MPGKGHEDVGNVLFFDSSAGYMVWPLVEKKKINEPNTCICVTL